jgi:hypothetical protein
MSVEMPDRIARLPRDKHKRPIPWFVHIEDDGTPDFRVIRRGGIEDALRFERCWVCGQQRGRHAAFLIGPMCAVNRTTAEPPSHLECAVYSAQACPFLTTPKMRRRDTGLGGTLNPAGIAITRNPGVGLVWSSRTWGHYLVDGRLGGGLLFDIGEPTGLSWWAEGRAATQEEVLVSINSGLPSLVEMAEKQGSRAVDQLQVMVSRAMELVPA